MVPSPKMVAEIVGKQESNKKSVGQHAAAQRPGQHACRAQTRDAGQKREAADR